MAPKKLKNLNLNLTKISNKKLKLKKVKLFSKILGVSIKTCQKL